MKKIFLSISLIISGLSGVFAQCIPDPNVDLNQIITPLPETPNNPQLGISTPACAGKPFTFRFTFSIPDTFNVPGFGPVPLNFVKIATTGAIVNAPAWMTYECFPVDCKFLKNTLGAVCLKGTPPANSTFKNDTLQIKAAANLIFLGSTLDYQAVLPKDFSTQLPGNYILRTRTANDPLCTVATDNLASTIYSISASPNPFASSTVLKIEALDTENLQFQVMNMLGQLVENRRVSVVLGTNEVVFKANDLPQGVYTYFFSNEKGTRTGKLMISN